MNLPFYGRNRLTSGYKTSDRPDHNGFDIVGDDNKIIHSISNGTVGFSGQVNDKATGGKTWQWGNYVRVDGEDGYKYYYCHMDSTLVSYGQKVSVGTELGVMGNTGHSFGAHTHLEIRKGTVPQNPSSFLGIPNAKGTYKSGDDVKLVYNGIDVSKYQGNIDWNKVKQSGQYFAFVRVGFCNSDGSITQQSGFDPYFERNMNGSIAAGLNVGVYVYSYAESEAGAIACADNVVNYVSKYRLTMPIAFDFENAEMYSKKSKQTNTNICKAFLERIQQKGYYAILYTYTNFANTYLDMSQLSAYDMWIADYRSNLGYKGNYSIWQYSSKGSVNGIDVDVDMNYMYKDLPSIIKRAGLNHLGDDNVEDTNLKNTYLEVNMVGNKNPNEYFNSMNTSDIAGRLDVGEYKVVNIYPNQSDGFNWAKIVVNNKEYYAVYDNGEGLVQDGRAILISKDNTEQKPDEISPDTSENKPSDNKPSDAPSVDSVLENLNNLVTSLNREISNIRRINDILMNENVTLKSKLEKTRAALKETLDILDS